MKKFLINVFRFSIIVCVFAIIGEIIVRHLPSSYTTKDKSIRKNGESINTLILGSSHTYYGLNPDVMGDSIFNLANVSQTPEYDLAIIKYYQDILPNLHRLIIPVSYFTYRDPLLEDSEEWTRSIKYKTRMRLPLHSDLSIFNLEICDFDGYTGQLKNIFLKQPSNLSSKKGFGLGYTLDRRDSDWCSKGQLRVATHTISPSTRFNEVLDTQSKILDLAKIHDWEVILITTPTHSSYYNYLEPKQEMEMWKGIEYLTKKYSINYFDFLRDTRFSDEDFYDSDHLSDIGATKLSKILLDTLTNKVD